MGQALQRTIPPGLLPTVATSLDPKINTEELYPLIFLDDELNDDEEFQEETLDRFPDLSNLPPELAIQVLKNLNATDLCLAACVWQQFATDNILWLGLCREQWQYTTIYNQNKALRYRDVFMQLDEGTLTFNSDPRQGMSYFIARGILRDDPLEIAKFIHGTQKLAKPQVRRFVQGRQDIVDYLVSLQNFANTFLPNALRKFFAKLEAPNDRGSYLQRLLERFSVRFCQCNPSLGMSVDSVYVMCFSLILLSVDLSSPHVKNKMSKREFIKNTRGAVVAEGGRGQLGGLVDDETELYGRLYDNIFLRGHVADGEKPVVESCKQQFVPGYLAMFL